MVGNGTQAVQNRAHRNDVTWKKTRKETYTHIDGQQYVNEYRATNGWAIRKHWGTGLGNGGWVIFNAAGERVDVWHSLTIAKAAVECDHKEAFDADTQRMFEAAGVTV